MHNKKLKPVAETVEDKPAEKPRKPKAKPATIDFSLGARVRIKPWQR
jgi:hypothetical protein